MSDQRNPRDPDEFWADLAADSELPEPGSEPDSVTGCGLPDQTEMIDIFEDGDEPTHGEVNDDSLDGFEGPDDDFDEDPDYSDPEED